MFGRDSCCHLLVIVTFDQVQCWDVISCSILWTCDVKSQLVVQDKFSENIALFTKTKEGKLQLRYISCEMKIIFSKQFLADIGF